MTEGLTPFNAQAVIKLALTYPLAWGYQQASAPYLGGLAQLAVVVALAVLRWVLLSRLLFPAVRETRDSGATQQRNYNK